MKMKTFFGKASAEWNGNMRRGTGSLSTGSGAITTLSYSSIQHRNDGHSCPDELMAAAQAGCFSLALANELGEAGFKSPHIATSATFTIEQLRGAWTIIAIHLDTTATVARMSQTEFVDAALRAKDRCALTRLFKAPVSMRARLNAPLKKSPGPRR
jgi:osmotically inducible protein OsmC